MRSALIAALMATFAPAAVTLADAPKASIKGPASVAPGGTIVLDARASVADRPLRWKLDGPDVPFLVLDQEGHKGVVALVPSAPAGVYKFTLIARGIPTGEVELDADAAIWIVVVEPPVPPAPPVPTPGPAPVPVPGPTPPTAKGTLHVSLVVDLDNMTADVAALREGVKARQSLKPLDAVYRTYAVTSSELDRLHLTNVAKTVGLPCLIFQDASGKILASEKAPSDEAGLIARVKSYRGATPNE
jgi:hypothetical protein